MAVGREDGCHRYFPAAKESEASPSRFLQYGA
jgi:hypothetical protein